MIISSPHLHLKCLFDANKSKQWWPIHSWSKFSVKLPQPFLNHGYASLCSQPNQTWPNQTSYDINVLQLILIRTFPVCHGKTLRSTVSHNFNKDHTPQKRGVIYWYMKLNGNYEKCTMHYAVKIVYAFSDDAIAPWCRHSWNMLVWIKNRISMELPVAYNQFCCSLALKIINADSMCMRGAHYFQDLTSGWS